MNNCPKAHPQGDIDICENDMQECSPKNCKEGKQITFMLFAAQKGNLNINKIMNACDMNDSGMKLFGAWNKLTITLKAGERFTQQKFMKFIKELEKIAYIGLLVSDDAKHKYRYVNKQYKMYSNGAKFLFVNELLKQMGLEEI